MKQKFFVRTLVMSALVAGLFTCGGGSKSVHLPTEVNNEFSHYISGYTSGQVSTRAVIKIELAEEQTVEAGAEIKDNLFTLTPAAKGKAVWASNRMIEFRPDDPLKEATPYKVSFSLGKVLPGLSSEFQTFTFDVYTIAQDFSIKEAFYKPVSDDQNRWNNMIVDVSVANSLSDKEIEAVFGARMGNKKLPVKLLHSSSDGQNFQFMVDNIERTAKDETLTLICDGKAVGSKKVVEREVVVHAADAQIFSVVSAQSVAVPERCIRIVFTDPLGKQNLSGLIDLGDYKSYALKTDKNVVMIYPRSGSKFPSNISGRIDKNIKNFAGKKLAQDYTFNIIVAPEVPSVQIANNGTILPDSRNLLFTFRAVNVRAVEMRVIKIYEHNILSFLQDNDMSGSERLTRSGRLIAKKLLRLDQDKSKVLTEWNMFAVDMSALVAKEPGAIYRVELIIREGFSILPCGDAESETLPPLDENNFVLTDDDMNGWNGPDEYYSPIKYDYSRSEWSERNNPCHPSFYMRTDNVYRAANLFASNVGIIVKRGDGQEMFVSAQDIRTAEPLIGAKVRILNYQTGPVATGFTDSNGFCTLNANGNSAYFVEVSHLGQKGYLKVANGQELSLSRFDVGGRAITKGLKGFIYGERGIWRPGDEIFTTFILEDREKTIPVGHPVTMEVYNPQGQFFRKIVQTSPVGNFYRFSFKTDEQSPTGLWRAVVSVGGVRFERGLRIETIKPNRLKINVDFGTDIITTQDVNIAVDATWLHGAIAKDLGTKTNLRLSSTSTTFKGHEAYNFNNPAVYEFSYDKDVYSGKLDDNGRDEFTVKMPRAENAPGMLMATFTTSVEESGGGESMTINAIPYSPFPAYVGLNTHVKKARDILSTDTTHVFDIVLLDARGKPVPSGELTYKAYRLDWSWWWDEGSSNDRLSSVVSGSRGKEVISERVSVKDGKARIRFKRASREWGRYLIYVKDQRGGHATGATIFVDDPYWGGRARQDDPQGLTMLSFTTDKPEYTVGEEVTITLGKAGSGRALVSLENGTRPIKQWWAETKEGEPTLIKFPVTEDLTPNFYVHITQLQQHHQTLNDMPIRMYGVVPVIVKHPLGELKPTIKMPDELRSEAEFTVTVGEVNKQNMTYTLAIVDEGLLDINNFKTPNPYAEFNVKEALGVKTFDLYNMVVGAFGAELRPLLSIGGDENLKKGEKSSQRFKPVVMFLGPFELKEGKTNDHKVKLPPYVGSVRAMVVAGNDRPAYGRAEKAVPVRNPLMVLTTLPRVLGPGEEVMMPVNLFVMDKAIRDVKVDVKCTDIIDMPAGSSQNVTFTDVGDKIVYFKMKTKRVTGHAKVTVTATSGKEVSSETIEIELRNPNPQLTVFDSYVVRAGESADIPYEFDAAQRSNKVKLEYARIPSVNLSRTLEYLIGYPHGCAEQSTSKAFPQLYLHLFANLSAAQKQEVQDNVNAVIKKLQNFQTPDGGISMWSGGSEADVWITSYVGHMFAVAKDQGYNVPQAFIDNWKKYQRGRVSNWNSNSRANDDLTQTYRLYSMALMGDPDLPAMNRLRERTGLSQLAKWQLAAAYAISGRKDVAKELINKLDTEVQPYSAFSSYSFGSSVRDEAIIMETCILLDDMDQALKIARRISDYLNKGSYSTQTTAWALMSMARFAGKSGKGDMAFTVSYLGKENKITTKDPVYMEDLADVKKSGNVRVTNSGDGILFVGRTMISVPFEDKSPAVNNQLMIQAGYTDLDGAPLDVKQLAQGLDFIANVTVKNPTGGTNYTNLALTHIIPSGWEITNTRLGNDSEGGSGRSEFPAGITYQDIRDDRILSYFDLKPGQSKTVSIRLQAAYLGKYFMPAIGCQAMYDNTVYARTTGTWVEVVK